MILASRRYLWPPPSRIRMASYSRIQRRREARGEGGGGGGEGGGGGGGGGEPMPPRRRWQLVLLFGVTVGLLAFFLGFWPVHEILFPTGVTLPGNPRHPVARWQPDPSISFRVGLMEGIMCLWFFSFGA